MTPVRGTGRKAASSATSFMGLELGWLMSSETLAEVAKWDSLGRMDVLRIEELMVDCVVGVYPHERNASCTPKRLR
jgi:hypothetical protein